MTSEHDEQERLHRQMIWAYQYQMEAERRRHKEVMDYLLARVQELIDGPPETVAEAGRERRDRNEERAAWLASGRAAAATHDGAHRGLAEAEGVRLRAREQSDRNRADLKRARMKASMR